MNFSSQIHTLYHSGNEEKKLHALAEMQTEGSCDLIYCLLHALQQSHNTSVRDIIVDTIIHLFRKNMYPRQLYQTLNSCQISLADVDFFEVSFDQQRLTYLLIISSLNENGYVREKAVRKLADTKDTEALPFLIQRLADWVTPVRQAAEAAVIAYLHAGKAKAFIMNLPLLDWLQRVERVDLTDTRDAILDYLTGRARSVCMAQFPRLPVKHRVLLARYLVASYVHREELLTFMADRYPLVRQVAAAHMEHLQPEDIIRLLQDKSPHIRLPVLRKLHQQRPDFSLLPFTADPAAGIRDFARYYLKDKGIDITAFYLDQLQQGQQLPGSLLGLAEADARQHAGTVARFLHHPVLRVAKAALIALKKLDDTAFYEHCLAHMDHPVPGFRHIILDYLSRRANHTVLQKARAHYAAGTTGLKLSMLQFFSHTGGWNVAADLMLGTIDPDVAVRDYSLAAVRHWQQRSVYLFSPLSDADRDRTRTILRFATEMHDQHQYFTENPLRGLAFYFP
ncbi:hypothetical protein SAMN04488128_104368 [Chitinophaga eiseniae]|uniref:HEAT repeat-containing protein n=1 Tax=Chitinophaga eiseniae TaxID=634771 RepID=A0A1T4TC34_9BACT|nr:hypothetical protein [Chitinophaga eiseniae]SKA37957.1 hypothetical protein SAMN04488128_104368 [Chitinophaga eiseniae]